MPGLIRGVARTAVVAGTATAVSNRVEPPASRPVVGPGAAASLRAAAGLPAATATATAAAYPPQYQQPAYQEPPPPPPAPAPAPVQAPPADVDMDSKLLQLRQLGELKTQGILSDAEFEAQKAKILGT